MVNGNLPREGTPHYVLINEASESANLGDEVVLKARAPQWPPQKPQRGLH